MTQQDYAALFNALQPGFFEKEYIRNLPEEEIYEEMILCLEEFEPELYDRKLAENISFGPYAGTLEEIQQIVHEVDPGWVQYYDGSEPIYCGYVDGRAVSFCLVSDMGLHKIGGQTLRIGGPGCVGTLPQYRDRGIGLTMVKHVTSLLKEQGCEYSYIHFTGVAPWYAKLGYRTCVCWNRNGITSFCG